MDYALADIKDVKAVVPFHGGLTSLAPVQTDSVYPYVLIQSGGIDDAHGDNTELEMALNGANATWEISRYSGVDHGFTSWTNSAYDSLADWRSWDAMLSVFEMILKDKDEMGNITGVDEMGNITDVEGLGDDELDEMGGADGETAVERVFGGDFP